MKKCTSTDDVTSSYSHLDTGHSGNPIKVSCAEPIFVNPNSYATVTEVLRKIGEAGNISLVESNDNETLVGHKRCWMKVTMDNDRMFAFYVKSIST